MPAYAPMLLHYYYAQNYASIIRQRLLVGDSGQMLQVLDWALTAYAIYHWCYSVTAKGAVRWLCVEQSRELFSDMRGRGGASNACFHS